MVKDILEQCKKYKLVIGVIRVIGGKEGKEGQREEQKNLIKIRKEDKKILEKISILIS
jgi:hypothetical protein